MDNKFKIIKNQEKLKSYKIKDDHKIKVDKRRIARRVKLSQFSRYLFSLSLAFAMLVLSILLYRVVVDSIGWLNIEFLTKRLSISPEKAGIYSVIMGSVYLTLIVIPVTLILGVSTSIYLEEYSSKGKVRKFINTNISNLASVPSVIFGLLGLTLFSRILNLGSSILAGGLTLSLLVLPIIVVSSQEAIRAVPKELKEASLAMGATKWTTVRRVVLPVAMPGILTGSILSISRAIGETAPLVVLGIPTLILRTPTSIFDDFTALPIQIYYWTLDTVLTPEYANLAAATIVVLLVVLLVMNSAAIIIRNRFQKKLYKG
ncbi:MAG: phosphate ABC transporter permease PstA [Clostridia bacterium]